MEEIESINNGIKELSEQMVDERSVDKQILICRTIVKLLNHKRELEFKAMKHL